MIGTVLSVWFRDGTVASCRPEGFDLIESAMARFVGESAHAFVDVEGRDSIIRLTKMSGGKCHTLASAVANWILETREDRERQANYEAEMQADIEQMQDRAAERFCTPRPREPAERE